MSQSMEDIRNRAAANNAHDHQPYLVYEAYSDTIRQRPQNYLLAARNQDTGRWSMDPDRAACDDLCVKVLMIIKEHSPINVLDHIK